jgi:hypothetical protein
MRLPVAENIALVSAGMTGGSAGSPRPVGGYELDRCVVNSARPLAIGRPASRS